MASDAQKRARAEVALNGLVYLLSVDEPVPRRMLFVPPSPTSTNKLQVEQALKKPWQTQFLDRLVEDNVLRRIELDGQISYELVSRQKIADIVADHRSSGLKLSKYLWPGSVITPGTVANIEVSATGEVTSVELLKGRSMRLRADEDDDEDGESGAAHDMKELFDELLRSQSANAKIISEVVNLLGENVVSLRKAVLLAGEGIDNLDAKIDKFEGKLDQKVGAINKRLDDLDKRVLDAHKLAEASHVVVKGFSTDTEALKRLRSELESTAGQVTASVTETVALRQSVNALLAQIKRGEEDQLSKLIKKLEANASESLALKDLLVGNLAEAGNG